MLVVLFAGLAPLQRLLLQNVPGQQLALGIGQCLELGADLVTAILAKSAVGNLRAQQQAEGLRHQDHLQGDMAADLGALAAGKTDATLGQADPARGADLAQQALGHGLAEQVDALVDDFQVVGQGAVTAADLPLQVLRLVIQQVQFAEQIEQRRRVVQHILSQCLGAAQGVKFQCDRIFDTVVFAAVIRVWCRHGEPRLVAMV